LHHQHAGDAGAARGARDVVDAGAIFFRARQHVHFAGVGPARPRALLAPSRKPRTMANISGSSSRKASWPLSVTISANDTRAPAAFSACTMARDSEVGNSQSLVKEITQNRVGVPVKALASTPS